jgi:hypothetical protein
MTADAAEVQFRSQQEIARDRARIEEQLARLGAERDQRAARRQDTADVRRQITDLRLELDDLAAENRFVRQAEERSAKEEEEARKDSALSTTRKRLDELAALAQELGAAWTAFVIAHGKFRNAEGPAFSPVMRFADWREREEYANRFRRFGFIPRLQIDEVIASDKASGDRGLADLCRVFVPGRVAQAKQAAESIIANSPPESELQFTRPRPECVENRNRRVEP